MRARVSVINDRPHPDPLPQKRETRWHALGSAEARSTNPAPGMRTRLEAILLLLGEKAGVRAVVLQTFRWILSLCFAQTIFAADLPGHAAPELDSLFQRTSGWVGADGNYSIPLSTNTTLWLFSDTWVGAAANGRRSNVVMINNSIA